MIRWTKWSLHLRQPIPHLEHCRGDLVPVSPRSCALVLSGRAVSESRRTRKNSAPRYSRAQTAAVPIIPVACEASWGTEGREFKSPQPDHLYPLLSEGVIRQFPKLPQLGDGVPDPPPTGYWFGPEGDTENRLWNILCRA